MKLYVTVAGVPNTFQVAKNQQKANTEKLGESEMKRTKDKESREDPDFLFNRAMSAGCCSFQADRDTGTSSNSIVEIAYGYANIKDQKLPCDIADLNACKTMWKKLPKHRKIIPAKIAMAKARKAIYRNEQ